MADGAPLVSVVIPTHYRNEWVRRAIESVLRQSYDPIEIIVVDDSGESHAQPVAAEYDITYIAHDVNQGGNPARNTGIEAANGSYIQLLDDDDTLEEEKITRQVAVMEDSANVGVVYCGFKESTGHCEVPELGELTDALRRALLFDLPAAPTSSLLIDAKVMANVVPLTSRSAADDIGMKIELARRTRFAAIAEVLVHKGKPDDPRGDSPAFADELFNIIERYRPLYRQYPPSVRREALSRAYQSRGYWLLQQHLWSANAIIAFVLASYYKPSFEWELVGSAFAAVFGAPGWRLAGIVYNHTRREPL